MISRIKVDVEESQDHIKITTVSLNELDKDTEDYSSDEKIRTLCCPAEGQITSSNEQADGKSRHEIAVPKRRWRIPLMESAEIVKERLIGIGIQDVDSRPFPNCSSEAVRETMERSHSRERLVRYKKIWIGEIRNFSRQLDSDKPMCWDGQGWYQYAADLRDRISQRALLLSWLEHYFRSGIEVALRYGEKVHLV